jgi:hypothetical protein
MAKPQFKIYITNLKSATLTASLRKEEGLFKSKRASIPVDLEGFALLEKIGIGNQIDDDTAILINNEYGDLFFKKEYTTGEYR